MSTGFFTQFVAYGTPVFCTVCSFLRRGGPASNPPSAVSRSLDAIPSLSLSFHIKDLKFILFPKVPGHRFSSLFPSAQLIDLKNQCIHSSGSLQFSSLSMSNRPKDLKRAISQDRRLPKSPSFHSQSSIKRLEIPRSGRPIRRRGLGFITFSPSNEAKAGKKQLIGREAVPKLTTFNVSVFVVKSEYQNVNNL